VNGRLVGVELVPTAAEYGLLRQPRTGWRGCNQNIFSLLLRGRCEGGGLGVQREEMMSWLDLFTRIDGRIGRKGFWAGALCLLLPELIAHHVFGQRWGSTVSLLLAYPALAVFIKRARDRGVPLWLPCGFIVVAVLFDVLTLLDLLGPSESPNWLFYILCVPFGILGVILLFDLGFRRGTVGAGGDSSDPDAPR
jgi:uncharacterized membrane protein YhaH (DUF805 family)